MSQSGSISRANCESATVGPINSTLDSIAANLGHLHELLCKSESTFGPVTRSIPPEKEANSISPAPDCDLHGVLMGINDSVNNAISRVNSLNLRCAL